MIMTKGKILESILSVLINQKMDVDTKCKNGRWSADVVVNCGTYKVAFNICKSPRNVVEIYKTMREERVCGCWLLMSTEYDVPISNDMPCFKLSEQSDGIYVSLNSDNLDFDDDSSNIVKLDPFIPSLIKGNIKFARNMCVKYIEVCFFATECWKCHKAFHVYFIKRLLSSDGVPAHCDNDFNDKFEFKPVVINAIEQFVKAHPEIGVRMGKIKQRFSNTRKECYPSFGCAFCDSLYGDFYYNDDVNEMEYCPLPEYRIEIPNGIDVPVKRWYKKND